MRTCSEAAHRAATVAGLRELAQFLEAHPELPIDRFGEVVLTAHPRAGTDDANRAEVDRIAALVDTPAGWLPNSSTHYEVTRQFGPPESLVVYRAIAISADHMARHRALHSYADHVQPEEEDEGIADADGPTVVEAGPPRLNPRARSSGAGGRSAGRNRPR